MINMAGQVERVLESDERLKRLVTELPNMLMQDDYTKAEHNSFKGKVNLSDINVLAARHFPLCMQAVSSSSPRCSKS
jgi:hypothetical protein